MNSRVQAWQGFPNVLETQQWQAENIEQIITHALRVEEAMVNNRPVPRLSQPVTRQVKIFFDEHSTRTLDTFTQASLRLGWHATPHFGSFSSEVKGESLEDHVMAITQTGGLGYLRAADYLVIRHKEDGAARKAAAAISDANSDGFGRRPLPTINAGDGSNQHPTQTLVDLLTIYRERLCPDRHPLDGITVAISGDARYGRTVNSLCHILGRLNQGRSIRIIFATHEELSPKPGMLQYLQHKGIDYHCDPDFPRAIREADIVYMTRIQRERMASRDLYPRVKGVYVFRKEYLNLLKAGAIVIHPLPINMDPNDPPPEIDEQLTHLARCNHPRLAWTRNSLRGIPARYALLDIIEYLIQQNEEAIGPTWTI